MPTAGSLLYQAHVAEHMVRLHDLVHDVPMLSTGVPCTNEAGEAKDCGKLMARVAFAPISVMLSFPKLLPFRLGGWFHGG